MSNLKICMVSSEKFNPAYDSLLLTLKKILEPRQITDIRTKSWMITKVPSILKPLLCLLQDLMLYLKILTYYKNLRINVILIFQGHYPLTCIGLSFLNLKLLLYIGGDSFKSSYYKKLSFIGRLMAFSNIIIQKICYRFSYLIILPSKSVITWLNLGEYANKIRSVTCIINPKFFNQFTIKTSYIKREKIIGYVGSLIKSKGILNLIQSIAIIKSKPNIQLPLFLVIGEGPLFNDLKVMVSNLGISENICLKGYIPHHDLPYYYNRMKFLVLPSFSEGLPKVILESMACGTPVLATPVGAIPNIIKEGKTGFLLKSNDPKHIAERIIELLNKPDLLEKVSINAYNYVRENFSYEKTFNACREILEQLEQD